jgi:outer membrane protein assembly factor BamB
VIAAVALALAAGAPLAESAVDEESWLRTIPGAADAGCSRALAVDPSGDARWIGVLADPAAIDGTALETRGEGDVVVARFAADGRCAWAKVAGGAARDLPVAVDVAADGSTVVAGTIEGDARFDAHPLPSLGSAASFLALYSADGRCEWVQRLPGRGEERVRDVAVDRTGGAVVAGTHVRQFSKGDVPEIYLARYARDGTRTWMRRAEGTGRSVALAVDGDGIVYLAGSSAASGTSAARVPAEGWPLVLAFDARGASRWRWEPERRQPTESEDSPRGRAVAVAAIAGGGCWVLGEVTAPARAEARAPGEPDRDLFLARVLPDGQPDWLLRLGGPEDDRAFDVAARPGGGCVISGSFHRSAHFEPWEVTGAGAALFVAIYDDGGNCVSVRTGASSAEPTGAALAAPGDGSIWISAGTLGRFVLGDREIDAEGEAVFLARLGSDGGP